MRLETFLRHRGRTLLAVACGVLAGITSRGMGAPPGFASLAGWVFGAIVFLVSTGGLILFDGPEQVRRRAGEEDEGRVVMFAVVLAAVGAGLAAAMLALHESKGHGPAAHSNLPLILSILSLVCGWLVVQSLFTLRYAHLYFGDRDGDGTADKGIKFPDSEPDTYRDFLYVAVCIGATCQVSDFNLTHVRFRNLVTVHALVAFVYNTMVLALGINILGSLMGQ